MQKIDPKKLKLNPENPRTISKDKFQKLVQSMKDFPEMFEARPIVVRPDMMVLGGNMRLRAAREAGLKEVPIHVVGWDEAKQSEFIIKDNVSFGVWDWDLIANEWNPGDLNDWGLDVWDPREDAVNESNAEEGEWVGMPVFEGQDAVFKLNIEFETKEELERYVQDQAIPILKKVPTAWSTRYPFDGRQDLGSLKYE